MPKACIYAGFRHLFKQLQEALLYKYLYFDTKTVGYLKNAANFCAVFIIYLTSNMYSVFCKTCISTHNDRYAVKGKNL